MNETESQVKAIINWYSELNLQVDKDAKDSSNMDTFYVVFIKGNKIKENYPIEMIDEVSRHTNFQDAYKAYAKLRIENPDKLSAIVMVGEDNIPCTIIPESVSLPNEDGSIEILVRGEDGIDHRFTANDQIEEWVIKKKIIMSK